MRFLSAFFSQDFLLMATVFSLLSILVIGYHVVRRRSPWPSLLKWVLPLFSMAIAGLTVGLLTGNSRVPVVGAVVPAFLSLITAYNIYLFSTNSDHKTTASLFTVVFSVFLIMGISTGAENRTKDEQTEKVWQQMLIRYETDMDLYRLRVIKDENLPFK